MTKIDTTRFARFSKIGGVAAVTLLAATAFAGAASAAEANPTGQYIQLENSSMVTSYTAWVGASSANEHAYSNGVTFSYQNMNSTGTGLAADTTVYTLFGFCVDIVHNMSLGGLGNYVYQDTYGANYPVSGDPVPDSFLLNGVTWGSSQANGNTTGSALNKLIDTGWLLHESQFGQSSAYINNVDLQLAAIQASIWKIEGGVVDLGGEAGWTAGASVGGTLTDGVTYTYQQYFNAYSGLNFNSLAGPNDKFYTILDTGTDPAHQGFAVGWPVDGVPEPATWAMMLTGFFGVGAMLRNRRKPATAAI